MFARDRNGAQIDLSDETQEAVYDAAYRAAEEMRLVAQAAGRHDYTRAREILVIASQDYAAADGLLVELERRQRADLARIHRLVGWSAEVLA